MASLENYFSRISSFTPSITLTTTILVVLIIIIIQNIRPSTSGGGYKLPPGPWRLPVIGNLHQLMTVGPAAMLPHHRLKQLADRYGRHVMRLQLGEVSNIIVVSTPEAARQVMKIHDHAFSSRPYLLLSDVIFYGNKAIAFSPAGDHWRRMRKLCVAELLSPKRVHSFRPIRESEASKLVRAVRSRSSSSGSVVDVTELLASATGGVTFRAAFGMVNKKSDEDEVKFSKLVADISKAGDAFRLSDLFPSIKFLPAMTGFKAELIRMHLAGDAMLEEMIREHRGRRAATETEANDGEAPTEDLVDVLLNLLENQNHDLLEVTLTMETTKAIILEMFLAGTETSATAMEWIMSEMMKNPKAMQRAQEEVRRVFHGSGDVREDGLDELKYLDSVIGETLRLHPPFPLLLPRESTKMARIDEYDVPEKARIVVNVWAIGRDPRHWKEPEKFWPERFFDDDDDECPPPDYKGTDFKLTPFGSGRRSCPGMWFGMAVVKLVIANLIYHFDWKLPAGMKPQDLDMTEYFGIAVRRKHNLCLIPVAYDPVH